MRCWADLICLTVYSCSFGHGLVHFSSQCRWTYADPSWARIAALVPEVVSCAEAGDQIADEILVTAVQELAQCVKAVVKRLRLCGEGD